MGEITIVGGGFAGVEAAWAAAQRGVRVKLVEMRPVSSTAVHKTGDLAELVCSNSFKSNLLTNASGVLKEEMRMLGSLVLPIAARHSVPAGEALAVDREPFAREVTAAVEACDLITIERREVTSLPEDRPLIIATGPLTGAALAAEIAQLTGAESLSFFDAVAPTVTAESLDMSRIFRASRRGRGNDLSVAAPDDEAQGCSAPQLDNADYLNCPFEKDEYLAFWQALRDAEKAPVHCEEDSGAKMVFFEMCVPVEELARRGPRTLAFGPMKPIGLEDPRTGRRPYAVVQLRQENREGTLWGLVGFQTRLKWGEQSRVLRMIPGLQHAEFVRYGVIHRNTYVNSPRVLLPGCGLREAEGVFLAGQITGVEGYLESAATGIVAGINAARLVQGQEAVVPPVNTVLGSLCRYLVDTDARHFSPMNSNWGIVPELETPIKDKREKARLMSERALQEMRQWSASLSA